MAVTNKDFKVKHGLIVEGTTGTIDNFDILTKKQDDQDYIVSLIGGTATPNNTPDTVVKRDGNGDFAAGTVTANRINFGTDGFIEGDGDGDIDIVATGDDVRITADDIRLNAIDDVILSAGDQGSVDGDVVLTTSGGNIRLDAEYVYVGSNEVDSERVATRGYVDQAETDAIASANSATDTKLTEYTKTVDLDTTVDGYGYLKSADLAGYATESYVDTAEADAISAAASDATTKANNAEQNAKNYADDLINDASNLSTEVWSAYKTSTEIGLAQAAAEQHADEAVAALVDGAPALLDTLNELAAAIADNPNYATDVANLVAGKQDTLTAGSNIDITGATISVTGLDTADVAEDASRLYFTNQRALDATSAAYDIAGAAQNAYNNAVADAASDATSKANTAQENAIDYTDQEISSEVTNRNNAITNAINALTTSDIEEGTGQYFTDVRAKTAAADLLTNALLTNITITGTGSGLTITAENGVADSTTSDLAEGSNLYFTDARAVSALEAVTPDFPAVEIASVAKQVAAQATVEVASTNTAVSWAKADFRSAEFLVKIASGTHTEVSKVILTLDTSDNIAMTEYAMVGTNGSLGSVSADVSGNDVRLRVSTGNNNSVVAVVGTLLK